MRLDFVQPSAEMTLEQLGEYAKTHLNCRDAETAWLRGKWATLASVKHGEFMDWCKEQLVDCNHKTITNSMNLFKAFPNLEMVTNAEQLRDKYREICNPGRAAKKAGKGKGKGKGKTVVVNEQPEDSKQEDSKQEDSKQPAEKQPDPKPAETPPTVKIPNNEDVLVDGLASVAEMVDKVRALPKEQQTERLSRCDAERLRAILKRLKTNLNWIESHLQKPAKKRKAA